MFGTSIQMDLTNLSSIMVKTSTSQYAIDLTNVSGLYYVSFVLLYSTSTNKAFRIYLSKEKTNINQQAGTIYSESVLLSTTEHVTEIQYT